MLNRHLLTYLPVYAAQILVGFGSVVVFTRLLSPEDYGRYTLVLAGALLTQTLVFTWLDAAVARHHARASARGRLGGHLATAFSLYAMLAVASLAVFGGVIALAPVSTELKTVCAFALVSQVLRSAIMIALETRRAEGEAVRFALLESLILGSGFGLGVVFILAGGMGPAGPFAGMALACLIAILIDIPVLLSKAKRDRAGPRRAVRFFAYGAPVAVSLVFEHLLSTGDRFVIAALLGEASTGAYAAGYGITDRSLNIIFIWLGMTAGPLAIKAFEHEGAEAARAVLRQAASLMGLIALPAATGIALLSEPFARLLIAETLADPASTIMPWIAVGAMLNGFMTYVFHESFVIGRRPKVMAALMAGSAIHNLALNLALIPVFGLVGAALATVISYALALVACMVMGRGIFRLSLPIEDWSKAAGASVVMGLVLVLLPAPQDAFIHLASHIPAGFTVYAVTALALDVAGCRSVFLLPFVRRLQWRSA
ncbi:MAG: lipopolysaccharide biosynthesis protein [Caulobacterales bacterium]|uniref:lipopolysaccharide biosynthesis protein n=1 Tax=Glycocaulis sp. TaxID=1969725 RepID=UPI003FA087E6